MPPIPSGKVDHTFWFPGASRNEDLASAQWTSQYEDEVKFSGSCHWPSTAPGSHCSVAAVSNQGTAVLILSRCLAFAAARNALLTRQHWPLGVQVLHLPECVRCEAAGGRKNASLRDPKYLTQSHCPATNHQWEFGLTTAYLLWASFLINWMGLMCLPLGPSWGWNGNIYKVTSTVPGMWFLFNDYQSDSSKSRELISVSLKS